jgi:hypothetical protein
LIPRCCCPCGSGKKYKHCCYGKGLEDDLGPNSRHRPTKYPIGTVAFYGPDDKTTTKIAAGVILHDGAETIIQRWVATDVTTNPKVQQELKDFFLQHGVKSVAMSQGTWAARTRRDWTFRTARTARFARSGRGNKEVTERIDPDGKATKNSVPGVTRPTPREKRC